MLVNLPLRAELKARVESTPTSSVAERGCADASLYRRFGEVGLANVKMFPQLAAYQGEKHLEQFQDRILPGLSGAEVREWKTAVAQAEADGTFFIARSLHCAVGTKP